MINMFDNIMAANNMSAFYGIYFLLWICSLLYLLFHHKEKEKLFQMLAMPTFVSLLVIFNPLCAIIIDKCLQGSFWRVYWIFNIVIVIACIGTNIVFEINEKWKKALAAIFIVTITVFGGTRMYSEDTFQKAENIYKIPNSIIEMCEVLHQNEINKGVVLEPEMVEWVRQYDATINTLYGRDLSTKTAGALVYNNLELFFEGVEEEECDYVVIAKERNWNEFMSEKGYIKCAETDCYDVWKVR